MPALVQALLGGNTGGSSPSVLVLSGSKVVSAGNTIFLALSATDNSGQPINVTDNLGNTYTQVNVALSSGVYVRLFRAEVTNPGTLTTITIDQTIASVMAAVSAEFSGVGNLRATTNGPGGASAVQNAYPGGTTSNGANYVANDLWIGAFAQASANTFAPESAGIAIPALEPIPEQKTSIGNNRCCGMLYYTSPSPQSGVALLGRFSASATVIAVGASMLAKVSGPIYNDARSGSLALAGTCVDSYSKAVINTDVVSGAVALSGSAVDSYKAGIVSNDTPSGRLALGGSVIEYPGVSIRYNDAPAGLLSLSGSCVDTYGKIKNDAPTGRVIFTGSSVAKYGHNDAPGGTYSLSGTANDVWFIHTGYYDAPSGRVNITGTVTVERRGYNDKPSDRLAFGGAAVDRNIRAKSPIGSIRMYGWEAKPPASGVPRPVGIPGAVVNSVSNVVNPTVLRPETGSGYEIGDLLICFAVAGNPGADLSSFVGAGWEEIVAPPPAHGIGYHFSLYGKIVQSLRESAPVLTFSTTAGGSGSPVMARIVAFRGLDTSDLALLAEVIGDPNSRSDLAGASAGGAAIVTNYDNDLVVSMTDRDSGAATLLRPPTGFGLVTWDYVQSGQRMTVGWAYQVKRPAGNVAAPVFTVSTTDPTVYVSSGQAVALRALPTEVHVSAPLGTLSLTGTRVAKHIYTDRPSGSISITGSIKSESHRWQATPTATLALSGSVAENWTHIGAERVGSISLTGQAKEKLVHINTIVDTLDLAGSADEDFHINIGDDKPVGRIVFGGTVHLAAVFVDAQTGDLVFDGVASDDYRSGNAIDYSDRMSGRIRLSGRAVHLRPPGFSSIGGHIVLTQSGRAARRQDGRVRSGTTGRKVKA